MSISIFRTSDDFFGVAGWSFIVVLAASMTFAATEARAQSWEYQTYYGQQTRSARGTPGGPAALGYITVEDRGGKAIFRMVGGNLDICYNRELDATVVKTEATTTITIVPGLQGCEEVRFVIRNDGTGGRREIKQKSDWVWDSLDRRLIPRK